MFRTGFLSALTVCLSLVVVACGGDGSVGGNGTGDSLADAFAEQLIGNGELRLDDGQVDCFAGQVISTVTEGRLGALGFTIDTIPSLYETDWTDEEIDLLVNSLDACVGGDPDSVKVILIGPTLARAQPNVADCYAAEVAAAAGEDFYLDVFRLGFTPPSVEDEEALRQVVEPALAVCQPNAPTPLPPIAEDD
jgi:hypothetical protein